MHELAICQALIEQVTSLAKTHNAIGVACIRLAIGPLAGVAPVLLENAFTVARTGSIASAAELIIAPLPILVHCPQCSQTTTAVANRLICSYCGNWQTQLISGDEMLLSTVELVLPVSHTS